MKLTVRIALLVGLGIMIALIVREGASSIAEPLARAGWVLLLLVPLHALPLLLDVLGWRLLIVQRGSTGSSAPDRYRVRPSRPEPPAARSCAPDRGGSGSPLRIATNPPSVPVLFWMASVREGVNRLLPVANIGGEVVGIRMLMLRGIEGPVAAASIIMEVLVTIVGQYVFVALGVLCLLKLMGAVAFVGNLVIGLAASLPVLALLLILLRYGSVFERIERAAAGLFGAESQALSFLGESANLDAAIRDLYSARGRLIGAAGFQLSGMLAGTVETWLALRWLGHPVDFPTALVLESLTQAARHFLFMVPAGVGVQEAGLVGFGFLLGLGSDVAIALSLAKRMREILFGVPALLSWYWMEGRREPLAKSL